MDLLAVVYFLTTMVAEISANLCPLEAPFPIRQGFSLKDPHIVDADFAAIQCHKDAMCSGYQKINRTHYKAAPPQAKLDALQMGFAMEIRTNHSYSYYMTARPEHLETFEKLAIDSGHDVELNMTFEGKTVRKFYKRWMSKTPPAQEMEGITLAVVHSEAQLSQLSSIMLQRTHFGLKKAKNPDNPNTEFILFWPNGQVVAKGLKSNPLPALSGCEDLFDEADFTNDALGYGTVDGMRILALDCLHDF